MITIPSDFPALPELSGKQEEDLGAFARNFAEAIRDGRADVAAAAFDNGMLLDRAVAGVTMPAIPYDNFRSGALSGMTEQDGGTLNALLGHDFQFLRIRKHDGEPNLIFRVISESGFNYYRFRIHFGEKDGAPLLYDFYNYNTGEYASESMRRAVLPLLVEMGADVSGSREIDVRDKMLLDNMEKMQSITTHIANGENYLALQKIKSLPGPLLNQRFVRALELQALSALPERKAEYVAAMELLEKNFANDPSLMIAMLDFYLLKPDTAKVRQLLDTIETEVGLDPYHDVLRASLYLKDGDYEKAQKSAWSVVSADPSMREAWLIILEAGLKGKNHRSVASALATMHTDLGMELGDSAFTSPAYADFFASPEGLALKAILEGGDPVPQFKGLGER